MNKKKKKIKLTELEKNLIKESENKDRLLASKLGWHLYHKTMFISGISALLILLAFFGAVRQKSNLLDLLAISTLFFAAFFVSITCYVGSRIGPSDEKKLDFWKWKKGKTLMSLQFTCYVFFILTILSSLAMQGVQYPIMSYALILLYLMGLIYYVVVYYILKNPIEITNGILTGIGSIGFIGIFIFPIIFFIEVRQFSFFIFLALILIVIMGVKIYLQIRERDFLNPVQYTVLKYIEPSRLFETFKESYNEIRNRIKALKILRKLDSKGDYGVKKALVEVIVKENTSSRKFGFTVLGGFLFFILTSIGEGFWQDLLYEPYLKPFLCTIHENFCK